MTSIKMSKFFSGAVVALVMALPSVGFSQTALNPGGTVAPLLSPINLNTNVLFGSDSFVSLNNDWSGTLYWGLWTNDALNPYGSDKLTFYYALATDAGNQHGIERLTINGWASYQTTVGYTGEQTFGTATPDSIDRSSGLGDTVGINWNGGIGGTFASGADTVVIWTDATSWGSNRYQLINGDIATGLTIAPIPEPEIYAMMAAGLGLMGFVARRRKQNAVVA